MDCGHGLYPGSNIKMPTVAIKIFGSGSVKISRQILDQPLSLIGVATQPSSDWNVNYGDEIWFSAVPNNRYKFEKYCSDSNKDGITTCDEGSSILIATITSNDELVTYFTEIPPPPTLFDWIWQTLFWWIPK